MGLTISVPSHSLEHILYLDDDAVFDERLNKLIDNLLKDQQKITEAVTETVTESVNKQQVQSESCSELNGSIVSVSCY